MTDRQIEECVLWELDLDPQVRATQIHVDVEEGIVVLSGYVDNEDQRRKAERAAKRVYGVRAVADELALKRLREGELPDTDLAREAVWALEIHNTEAPADRLQVTVCEGLVTLEGEVGCHYQKEAAEAAIARLAGARGITNQITVRTPISPMGRDLRLEEALGTSMHPCLVLPQAETDECEEIVRENMDAWAMA
jgi:osmotically-inducible protein OsmY